MRKILAGVKPAEWAGMVASVAMGLVLLFGWQREVPLTAEEIAGALTLAGIVATWVRGIYQAVRARGLGALTQVELPSELADVVQQVDPAELLRLLKAATTRARTFVESPSTSAMVRRDG